MQIIFNGKSYGKLEDMPANEREAFGHMEKIFTDANGNGIPDFMEGDVAQNVISAFTSNVNFQGKVYNNLDELPEPARKKVQEAFAKLNQLGIVNPGATAQDSTKGSSDSAFQPSAPLIQAAPLIGEKNPNRWVIIFAVTAGLFICGLTLAVIFLLQR